MPVFNPISGQPIGNAGAPTVQPAPQGGVAPTQMAQAGLQNRVQAFSAGATPASGGLAQSQMQSKQLQPSGFRPNSPLQQIMPSANGLGTNDANRQLMGGGMIPTPNGMSANTYQVKRPFLNSTIGR